ncbi:zf-C3HC-domain-containing protein [Fistulina hepatica ATCC 64428]|uniref:Zf-C3HC-domain-containing protein n=1 Tax=Fistulina hepatica ATCC 64428 TaxID=1128425 RepID=A0A0D7AHI5_9AGAR|nr:zf-C3HC-domain-containing protein [Fistulina hepatica ATCC 64428]
MHFQRKLDDAFNKLDVAVAGVDDTGKPPMKRTHTARSLQSTLAKYGISRKTSCVSQHDNVQVPCLLAICRRILKPSEKVSQSTPRLTALLSRAAARTRKVLPLFSNSSPDTTSPEAEYSPSSVDLFLSRLATFKLTTYANKPSSVDAVAAARCGWINEGKDRLLCKICYASWVVASTAGMSRDAANTLLEKQRTNLVEIHKVHCPWRAEQCDPSIYCIPLQSPAAMVRTLRNNALQLEEPLRDVDANHPLTVTQLHSLRRAILVCPLLPPPLIEDAADDNESRRSSPEAEHQLSDKAILAALFGWSPAPPPAPPRVPSLSRAVSRATTFSRASSVSGAPSRAPSVAHDFTPGASELSSLARPVPMHASTSLASSVLHCVLCQRRIGLWAFVASPHDNASAPSTSKSTFASSPTRRFDLLKEHRAFCPYVVRSTMVPSLARVADSTRSPRSRVLSGMAVHSAANPNALMEGWRAVLTVVLRYGAGQQKAKARLQGLGSVHPTDGTQNVLAEEPAEEDDVVDAILAGVKRRGGRDLVKYVKGILGSS